MNGVCVLHCVKKNDTDVARYNFNTHQPIITIFGRDVAERVHYQVNVIPPLRTNVCTTWRNMYPKNCLFSYAVYCVSKM